MYAIASSISDFNAYRQDVEQFEFTHKFDLQHHLSISTIGANEQELSSSDTEVAQNNSAISKRKFQSLSSLPVASDTEPNRQVISS